MKIVICGDPHIQNSNLDESQRLLDFIISTAKERDISNVLFSGDLFHQHSVIRGQVLNFWHDNFEKLSKLSFQTYVTYGNHDYFNQKVPSMGGSLDKFNYPGVYIIKEPSTVGGITLMPYYHDREKFIIDSNILCNQKLGPTKTLICHQNFTQSLFGDMIDPILIDHKNIIAGHIHSHHLSSGKVFYAGTPKWDSATDAGEEKGIWIFDFADDGDIISKEFISTRSIVTPIDKLFFNEGDEEPNLDPKARNYLEIKGQSAWINKMKKKYKGMANIKAVYTDRIVKSNKETSLDFTGFMSEFKPIDGVSSRDIEDYIKDLNEK
jgi:DNA repair exonuclease SbcCD nuclease subunit